jgi:hypothetical protein
MLKRRSKRAERSLQFFKGHWLPYLSPSLPLESTFICQLCGLLKIRTMNIYFKCQISSSLTFYHKIVSYLFRFETFLLVSEFCRPLPTRVKKKLWYHYIYFDWVIFVFIIRSVSQCRKLIMSKNRPKLSPR